LFLSYLEVGPNVIKVPKVAVKISQFYGAENFLKLIAVMPCTASVSCQHSAEGSGFPGGDVSDGQVRVFSEYFGIT
jgi:hypothetical protein